MSTAVPLNLPGAYITTDFRQDRVVGHIGNYYFNDAYTYTIDDSFSAKPPIVHGDHVQSTPYYREAVKLITDLPSENRYQEYYNGELRSDYRTLRHISRDVPTMHLTPPGEFLEDLANSRSAAITKGLNALRGEGSVENGADLAEARQTLNMIAQSGIDLLSAAKAAKQGNWPAVANALGISKEALAKDGHIANSWLGYQYGWKPLMGSIHDNIVKLRSMRPSDQFIIIKRNGGKVSLNREYEADDGMNIHWQCSGNSHFGLRAVVENEFQRNLDSWGLINPFSVAWEVVPFSFVFDWLMPIGNCLSAYSASAGLRFLDGYVSTKWEHSVSFTRRDWDIPGKLTVVGTRLDRHAYTSFPMPELYGKANPFSTQHVLNFIALLNQAI